jgi:alpha-D-xyloside xylohydrolase
MRPLVMDFRTDVRAQNIGDQFLFGPSILVSPVTEPGATTRHLYLPKAQWYDFWTGNAIEGGKTIDAPVTLDRIPLYVRAGSIIAHGPGRWSTPPRSPPTPSSCASTAAPTLTSPSTKTRTTLSSSYYEKGAYATIPIDWNEAGSVTGARFGVTLTIGDRHCSLGRR